MAIQRKRIAVVGAATQQGSSVVEALMEYSNQWQIRGITKDRSLPFSQVTCSINCKETFLDLM